MNGHGTEPCNDDYDPGYPQTYDIDFDNAYDRVTAHDIADLLHHLAELRCNPRNGVNNVIDPTERAAFLSRKARVSHHSPWWAARSGLKIGVAAR